MRIVKVIALLGALTAALSPAMADSYGGRVWYDRVTGYYVDNGGEFTLSSDGGQGLLLSNAAYVPGKTCGIDVQGRSGLQTEGFQTFCVEVKEFVAQPMDIVLSTYFINQSNGAITGPGSHAVKGSTTYGDNLDARTAYLYHTFAKGQLSSYGYSSGRSTSAGLLQQVIWYIEGEQSTLPAGQARTWYNQAVDATGVEHHYNGTDPSGTPTWGDTIGDVRVLTTWSPGNAWYTVDGVPLPTDPNVYKQDQLYLIPAPGAALLGVLGLSLVGWVKRRLS